MDVANPSNLVHLLYIVSFGTDIICFELLIPDERPNEEYD